MAEKEENILDYVRWRGDLSFAQTPLCSVDSVVFSRLSSLPFSEFIPKDFSYSGLKIKDICQMRLNAPEKVGEEDWGINDEDVTLLKMLIESRRFSRIPVLACEHKEDEARTLQFSATSFLPDKSHLYVGFGGTNRLLSAFRENLNMSFSYSVPGQRYAVDYLKRAAVAFPNRKIMIGGHSKGGNFAAYAAAYIPKEIKQRIAAVYNLDGPGFLKSVAESSEFAEILPVLHTFVPQGSVIGILLDYSKDFNIVHSTAKNGVSQHFLYSWQVCGDHFVPEEGMTRSSHFVDRAAELWVEKLTPRERAKLIDGIFSILEQSGVKNVNELLKIGNSITLLRTIPLLDDESRDLIHRSFQVLREVRKEVKSS